MKTNAWTTTLVALAGLLLAGCDFDAPLTATATQKVNPQLLGNWRGRDQDPDRLTIRQLDDARYIATIDGDVYLVHHSTLAGREFVSARDLNDREHKYCYYLWSLALSGDELSLRRVSTKVVPAPLATPEAAQQELLKRIDDPRVLEPATVFVREKR